MIPSDLGAPELGPRGRPTEELAVMAVPEASVHEYDGVTPPEHKIGCAGKSTIMQPKAEAALVKGSTQLHLRTRVLGANTRHHPAAVLRGSDVRHGACRPVLDRDPADSLFVSWLRGGLLLPDERRHRTRHRLDHRNDNRISELPVRLRV